MENKVLIKLIVPEIEKDFDVYIPVNELVWKIKFLLSKSICDLCYISFNSEHHILINNETGKIYGNNEIIIDTDIRNGSEIIFISKE